MELRDQVVKKRKPDTDMSALKDDWLRDNGYPVQVVRKSTK